MFTLTLPDGGQRSFSQKIDGRALAAELAQSLGKKAIALKIDGAMNDLAAILDHDAQVEIITPETKDGLELLRHDAAHVMAEAVQELFPGTQVTIGPVIDNGFFYDFAKEIPFTPDDLEKIEERMHEIVERDEKITREVWPRDQAIQHFREIGEEYKAQIIEAIPADQEITIYRQGAWMDLCRGPHLPSTGRLGHAFKLMRIAGAYWRGSSDNEMLQRIYGTAWATKKQLDDYLTMIEEAVKRDHRVLGPRMELFHLSEEAAGAVFWHPRGWRFVSLLSDYLRARQDQAGYQEINTPDMMQLSLWEKSGHWEKFGANMFTSKTEDDRIHALKPMSCPGHVEVFKYGQRSYRDLPLRFSEFGKVHRYEPSGALHGILRVRHFTQDDAHIFCTPGQIEKECADVTKMILAIYSELGFTDVRIQLSGRPEKSVGSDQIWRQAEDALARITSGAGVAFEFNPGEGAFYGPKLDFTLRDAIGREWQCGTVQLDFTLPQRLGAVYIAPDGSKQTPVMIHRALFGSIERFAGILIEHHEGWLPFWMAPLQAVITPITNEFDAYACEVADLLKQAGLRVQTDLRSEKVNYKVRAHGMARVPLLCAVGGRDLNARTVALRWLKEGTPQTMTLDQAVQELAAKNAIKTPAKF